MYKFVLEESERNKITYRIKLILSLHVSLDKLNIMDGFLYLEG
jgi:hypothetical protein